MVARLSLADIFIQTRDYLDTDELNMPNSLLDVMLQRVWFEAINMEPEWRFLNIEMTVAVPDGTRDLPMAFTPDPPPVPPPAPIEARRINFVQDATDRHLLPWVPLHEGTDAYNTGQSTKPVAWTETSDGFERKLRLFPTPAACQLIVAFYAVPTYPTGDLTFSGTFADLPQEFDQALKTGLLAETYLREEDPELYDAQRQVYLNAMGSIREAWKVSTVDPLVLNRSPLRDDNPRAAKPRLPSGF